MGLPPKVPQPRSLERSSPAGGTRAPASLSSTRRLAAENAALSRLHELSIRLVSQDALPTLLDAIVDTAIEISGASMGDVQVVDAPSGELRLIAHRGFEQPFLDHFAVVRDGAAAPCASARRERRRVIVEDVSKSRIFLGKPALSVLEAAGVRSVQSTPLVARDGTVLGVFSTHWSEPHRPDEGTLRVLDLLAREASSLIEHRQREDALREADRRKNEFLAVLSHELRNPLAAIQAGLHVLGCAAPGSDQALRADGVVHRQLAQLNRLVDDLLDLTRIARNKIRLERRAIDLDDLVRQTVEDQRPLFDKGGVTLEIVGAPSPSLVDGDWNRLAQAVGNLLQNAAKFTARGGAARVHLRRDADAKQAVLRIADTGSGMTEETLATLFRPFVQAETTLDRSRGGLGLGLSLVKAIVDLHGGDVTAESAGLGLGSELVVRLPLAIEEAPAASTDLPILRGGGGRRVLVIDDNVDVADMLRDTLVLGGDEVAVAHDGPTGLRRAREIRPEIIVCDIGLPGMDGYEVARAVRSEEALRGTLLVALSGYAQPEDIERSAAAGFDRHLAKPLTLEELHEILARGRAPAAVARAGTARAVDPSAPRNQHPGRRSETRRP